MDTMVTQVKSTIEEELHYKRIKHEFVQWLVSGNRRAVPTELKPYVSRHPEEARALFNHFRGRSRRRARGKKYLFSN